MTDKDTGGPAFPSPEWSDAHGTVIPAEYGMTMRDYFAAKALQGLLSDTNMQAANEQFALFSYKMADAMLAERSKK